MVVKAVSQSGRGEERRGEYASGFETHLARRGLHIHTYTHTYIYTYIHIYIHTYIYTYIHIYIYTYIYILLLLMLSEEKMHHHVAAKGRHNNVGDDRSWKIL